jgi:glycosyltransferase involved in cell wall biosynthesis
MSRIVCYIPSYNDSALVSESLSTVSDWEVVISDNASEAAHAAALDRLAGDRVRVIHQPKQLGRVGNWKFCVSHFIDSGADWMKFLPAGDRHKPDSLGIFRRALDAHPDARFVIGNVEIVWADRRRPWNALQDVVVRTPEQAMVETVERGNVFFGLLSALIHVDAVREGFSFAEEVLNYCADMFFLLRIARRSQVVYLPAIACEFVAENRKTFYSNRGSFEHLVEEGLVRLRAADYYAELTGDRARRDQLIPVIAQWLRERLDQSPGAAVGIEG